MISFEKYLGSERLPPLTWYRVNLNVGEPTERRTARAACSNGHSGLLDHEIAADGTITPSVVCPEPGCDFHDFVRLEDWEAA